MPTTRQDVVAQQRSNDQLDKDHMLCSCRNEWHSPYRNLPDQGEQPGHPHHFQEAEYLDDPQLRSNFAQAGQYDIRPIYGNQANIHQEPCPHVVHRSLRLRISGLSAQMVTCQEACGHLSTPEDSDKKCKGKQPALHCNIPCQNEGIDHQLQHQEDHPCHIANHYRRRLRVHCLFQRHRHVSLFQCSTPRPAHTVVCELQVQYVAAGG
mmetsp:Transcript_12755/g.28915  ORF Transcript_12755/g.28915 Transcript_12755/m.28915 type:complete len:208 (-) Transcript_12755:100-723(-)